MATRFSAFEFEQTSLNRGYLNVRLFDSLRW